MKLTNALRMACGYENVDAMVRTFNSRASNGLVLDAAEEIECLCSINANMLAALMAVRPFVVGEGERPKKAYEDLIAVIAKANALTAGKP